jgi:hypothetical protein
MAKKTRKVLKQASQQRAIQQAAVNVNTALTAVQPAAGVTSAAAGRTVKASENRVEDYRYVRSDLRRIGLLAVSFTAILIALSFVIR